MPNLEFKQNIRKLLPYAMMVVFVVSVWCLVFGNGYFYASLSGRNIQIGTLDYSWRLQFSPSIDNLRKQYPEIGMLKAAWDDAQSRHQLYVTDLSKTSFRSAFEDLDRLLPENDGNALLVGREVNLPLMDILS